MKRPRAQAGSSLVEVVIALGILLILMIGILQMFSMAYLTNVNAAADTDLAYKAQQTAEVLRWAFYQQAQGATAGTGANALPVSELAIGTHTLPNNSSGLGWAFWGPSYLNVVTRANPPYTVTYTVADAVTDWTINIRVTPKIAGSYTYVGAAKRGKVVEYVVQAPKTRSLTGVSPSSR